MDEWLVIYCEACDSCALRTRSNSGLCFCNITMGVKQARQRLVALLQVVMFLMYLVVQGVVYMHCGLC